MDPAPAPENLCLVRLEAKIFNFGDLQQPELVLVVRLISLRNLLRRVHRRRYISGIHDYIAYLGIRHMYEFITRLLYDFVFRRNGLGIVIHYEWHYKYVSHATNA